MVQKLLSQTQLTTKAISANTVVAEKKKVARRLQDERPSGQHQLWHECHHAQMIWS